MSSWTQTDVRKLPREQQTRILACMLFGSVLIYVVVSHFILQAALVEGSSMVPSLRNGERILIHRWAYRIGRPQRGDIVAIDSPHFRDLSVKRVVAIPGDTVQFAYGNVYVNRRELHEPYLRPGELTRAGYSPTAVYVVEDDCYFVLGDNRDVSLDSRAFGAVPRRWIIGRVGT